MCYSELCYGIFPLCSQLGSLAWISVWHILCCVRDRMEVNSAANFRSSPFAYFHGPSTPFSALYRIGFCSCLQMITLKPQEQSEKWQQKLLQKVPCGFLFCQVQTEVFLCCQASSRIWKPSWKQLVWRLHTTGAWAENAAGALGPSLLFRRCAGSGQPRGIKMHRPIRQAWSRTCMEHICNTTCFMVPLF